MAKKLPVITSTIRWDSRQEALDECQEILRGNHYLIRDPITDSRHIDVLSAILSIHPNASSKSGSGVSYFYIDHVATTPGVQAAADDIGFWVMDTDGNIADFSYVEAISPSDQKKKVTSALRAAIEDLRTGYRDARFSLGVPVLSDVSGSPFTRRSDASVIYRMPTFSQLAYRFAESEGGWDAVEVVAGERSPFIGDELKDPDVRIRWRDFFKTHAVLELATKSEGASRPRYDETGWTP